jgi:hypothetical protein
VCCGGCLVSGTLPPDLGSASHLVNVSVAYNKISGTIPHDLKVWQFVELCLGYNKLSGFLSSRQHTPERYGQSRPFAREARGAAAAGAASSLRGDARGTDRLLYKHSAAAVALILQSSPSSSSFSYSGHNPHSPQEEQPSLGASQTSGDADESSSGRNVVGEILSLENNRLTGFVPQDLEGVQQLNVLDGNFFDCDPDHRLPDNDPAHEYYICGSNNLDQSLYIWLVLFMALFVMGVVIFVVYTQNKRWRRAAFRSHTAAQPAVSDGSADHQASLDTEPLLAESSAEEVTLDQSGESAYARDFEEEEQDQNSSLINKCCEAVQLRRIVFKHWMVHFITCCLTWFRESELRAKDCDANEGRYRNIKVIVSLLAMLRRTSVLITVLIVAICVPLYISLKLAAADGNYSTHTHQYGWLVSSAFMTGDAPASCVLLLFMILSCVLAYCMVALYPRSVSEGASIVRLSMVSDRLTMVADGADAKKRSVPSEPSRSSSSGAYSLPVMSPLYRAIFTSIFVTNIVVNLTANFSFVYVFNTSKRYAIKVSAKVVLALFQLLWNTIVVPKSVETAASLVHDSSSRLKWLILLCLIFNYIVGPVVATTLSASTCFSDAFVDPIPVQSFYSYDVCRTYVLDMVTGIRSCSEVREVAFSTSFIPPFMYYYQCSGTLITQYVTVYMIEHAVLTVFPALIALVLCHHSASEYLPNWILRSLPSIVWPPEYQPPCTNRSLYPDTAPPLLRPDRLMASLMSHFAVLLTYGLFSPFLAITICSAICSVSLLCQTVIGRYLFYHRHYKCTNSANNGTSTAKLMNSPATNTNRGFGNFDAIDAAESFISKSSTSQPPADIDPLVILDDTCCGVLRGLPSCLWTIIIVTSVFVSVIVLDMAGDKMGWEQGLAVALPCLTTPIFAYLVLRLTLYHSHHRSIVL